MGFLSRLNIFGRHKKIERFMFSFFVIAIPLVLMTFVSIYNKFGLDQQSLSSNALYSSSVTLSRTGQTGKVEGVFVNKDKKYLILLHVVLTTRYFYSNIKKS